MIGDGERELDVLLDEQRRATAFVGDAADGLEE